MKLTRYLIAITCIYYSNFLVTVLGYYCCLIFVLIVLIVHVPIINTRTFFNCQINVYEPFCTVITHFFSKNLSTTILTHILPWTKTGTEPALDVLTTPAKPLNNAGQFVHVTEINVPTVLTQQAQKIGVAAIKNNGNQIFQIY